MYLELGVWFFLDSTVYGFVDVVVRRFPAQNQESGGQRSEPLILRPTRHGVFLRTDLRIFPRETLNIISIVCEAETSGREGAPTSCYTISIDYV